jgi:putative membrane protein
MIENSYVGDPTIFPALNAGLNALSAIFLWTGRSFVIRKRIDTHRNLMLAAFVTSSLFLVSYLYFHFAIRHGVPTRFEGSTTMRTFYLVLLGTHTILATVMVPMILVTLTRGLRRSDVAHRRIARWTFPIWMYVSVTGVVVYFMLYHLSR